MLARDCPHPVLQFVALGLLFAGNNLCFRHHLLLQILLCFLRDNPRNRLQGQAWQAGGVISIGMLKIFSFRHVNTVRVHLERLRRPPHWHVK